MDPRLRAMKWSQRTGKPEPVGIKELTEEDINSIQVESNDKINRVNENVNEHFQARLKENGFVSSREVIDYACDLFIKHVSEEITSHVRQLQDRYFWLSNEDIMKILLETEKELFCKEAADGRSEENR